MACTAPVCWSKYTIYLTLLNFDCIESIIPLQWLLIVRELIRSENPIQSAENVVYTDIVKILNEEKPKFKNFTRSRSA